MEKQMEIQIPISCHAKSRLDINGCALIQSWSKPLQKPRYKRVNFFNPEFLMWIFPNFTLDTSTAANMSVNHKSSTEWQTK